MEAACETIALAMGREQRSRRKLPAGTFCYLCGKPITEDQEWNRDHVPPQRLFAKSVRRQTFTATGLASDPRSVQQRVRERRRLLRHGSRGTARYRLGQGGL